MLKRAIHLVKGGLPNSLIATGVTALAGLLSGIILARTLGPTLRGEYAAAILIPGMIAFLAEFGLGFSFSYHVGKQPESTGTAWLLVWLMGAGLGSVLAICTYLILPHIWSVSSTVYESLRVSLISVPLILLVGYEAQMLLGSGHILEHNIARTLIGVSYAFGVVIVAIWGGQNIQFYATTYVVSFAIATLVATYFVCTRLQPRAHWNQTIAISIYRYGIKSYSGALAAQSNLRLDQYMMVGLTTATQLGLYVAAVSLSALFQPVFAAISVVTVPKAIQCTSINDGGKVVYRYTLLGAMLGVPLAIVAAVASPLLVRLLFGTEFSASAHLAQVLMFAALFQGCNVILGNGIRAMGFPGRVAVADSIGLIITISMLLVLLPRIGALGAAVTSLIAYMVVTITLLAVVLKLSRFTLGDMLPSRRMLFESDRSQSIESSQR